MKKLINNYKKWNPSIYAIIFILLIPFIIYLIRGFELNNDTNFYQWMTDEEDRKMMENSVKKEGINQGIEEGIEENRGSEG